MMNNHAAGEGARRRDDILRIIRESAVHSQDELLAVLRKSGFKVTQPTLSRDLRELGVAKSPAGYVAPGALATVTSISAFTSREDRQERVDRLVRTTVLSAQAAGNLVVVRTPVAAAQPLASALDAAQLDDVLGTIGGDDTIFIALASPTAAAAFARQIQETAGINPARRGTR
jgi:transcriptional regulator of arginine metabolism